MAMVMIQALFHALVMAAGMGWLLLWPLLVSVSVIAIDSSPWLDLANRNPGLLDRRHGLRH